MIREVIARLDELGVKGHFSVSHTTRARRPAETDGVDYHFADRSSFEAMVRRGEFLEWAEYNGNLYGTAREEVESRLSAGQDVFLDIEVQGAYQVKTRVPDVVKIFVYPPSYEVLKERLVARGQDAPESIRQRLVWAMREFGVAGEFDGRAKYQGVDDLWNEREREARIRDLGIVVVRWTWADLRRFDRTAARLAAALGERGRRIA